MFVCFGHTLSTSGTPPLLLLVPHPPVLREGRQGHGDRPHIPSASEKSLSISRVPLTSGPDPAFPCAPAMPPLGVRMPPQGQDEGDTHRLIHTHHPQQPPLRTAGDAVPAASPVYTPSLPAQLQPLLTV